MFFAIYCATRLPKTQQFKTITIWSSLAILWVYCGPLCSVSARCDVDSFSAPLHLTESSKVAYFHYWLLVWALLETQWGLLISMLLFSQCVLSLKLELLKGQPLGFQEEVYQMGLDQTRVWFIGARFYRLANTSWIAYKYPLCLYPRITVYDTVHKILKSRLPMLHSIMCPT